MGQFPDFSDLFDLFGGFDFGALFGTLFALLGSILGGGGGGGA